MQKLKILPRALMFPTWRQHADHNNVVAIAQPFEYINDTMHESFDVDAFKFLHSQRIQIATNMKHAPSIILHRAITFLAINTKNCALWTMTIPRKNVTYALAFKHYSSMKIKSMPNLNMFPCRCISWPPIDRYSKTTSEDLHWVPTQPPNQWIFFPKQLLYLWKLMTCNPWMVFIAEGIDVVRDYIYSCNNLIKLYLTIQILILRMIKLRPFTRNHDCMTFVSKLLCVSPQHICT